MYFQLLIPLHLLFREGGGLTQQPWLALWKGDLANQEQRTSCTLGIPLATVSVKLQANCFYIVAERQIENKVPLYCALLLTIILLSLQQTVFYGSSTLVDGTVFLSEIQIDPSTLSCILTCKSFSTPLSPVFLDAVKNLLC